MKPNEQGLARAFNDQEIFATDVANDLVRKGMAFRDAYKQVGENLSKVEKQDAAKNIRSKKHLGATGNLGLELLRAQLQELQAK